VLVYIPTHEQDNYFSHVLVCAARRGETVGRKLITARAAVLRWIESSAAEDTLARAIERGDREGAHPLRAGNLLQHKGRYVVVIKKM
jgi:hypothetical protein